MPTGILSNVRGSIIDKVDLQGELNLEEVDQYNEAGDSSVKQGALPTSVFSLDDVISGSSKGAGVAPKESIIRQGSIGSLTWTETADCVSATNPITKVLDSVSTTQRQAGVKAGAGMSTGVKAGTGVRLDSRSPVVALLKPSKRLDPEPAYRSLKTLSELVQQDSSQDELKRMLAAFDYCARKQGYTQPLEITICGKGALVLKGYSSDDTQDIDVIDEIPEIYRELAEAFSINNQARAMVPKSVGLLQRREAYTMEFDVLHVYLLSDADLLLNHLSRGLRKDILNIFSSRLLNHVTKEMFMDAVVDYPHKEFLIKKFEKLCQLGGYPYGL